LAKCWNSFWRHFWQSAGKVFGSSLAKCQEFSWKQIYEMPLISNSGILQEMPPKLFPSSFGKVPANPNRGNNWKCLQIQIDAVKLNSNFGILVKIWNHNQILESQVNL
jgi:hypothetical protein